LAPPNRFRYSSVEQIQSALSSIWDVEITQSDRGPLDGSLNFRQLGECLVYGSQSNRSLVIVGRRATDHWTITPVTADSASGRYRGRQLDQGDLLLLNPGGEVFQRISPGHRQNAISIPLPLAERIIRAEYQLSPQALWGRWCIRPDPRITPALDRILASLLAEPSPQSTYGHSEIDFAAWVIAMANSGSVREYPSPGAGFRRRVVARADELIRSRLDHPPSITELCEATHVSRRALFYAFGELLGRSPGAHAKVVRLHAARRRIIQLRHQRCVQQVALELGFNHPGQFAIDYAKLFGELPSETGKRARSSVRKWPQPVKPHRPATFA